MRVEDFYRNLPRLETTRLTLRKATSSDAPDVFVYSSDGEVTRYLRWGPHETLTETENYIQGVLDEYREGKGGPWMIELKQSHTVIGHIHLMDVSLQHSKAQVGVVLAIAYWSRGLATEALNAVLEYSFAELGLNRVEGWSISANRAAARALEEVGMTKEGELRDYLCQKGAFWDSCAYAMLREEFSTK